MGRICEKSATSVRRHLTVTGVVQGVGFRPFVYSLAMKQGLGGWVRNCGSGVEIEAEGAAADIDEFVRGLQTECPPLARVGQVAVGPCEPVGERDFTILSSSERLGRSAVIPPDVAICKECTSELLDPADPRSRYPFINCTQCGPRFTIVEEVPYDRQRTTMRGFDLCVYCGAEYTDPINRRFHAEPVACPACGPELTWRDSGRDIVRGERALRCAVSVLASGGIVALKGLGGFHIACDATDQEAVLRLRRLKDRPGKPFAIMSRSVEDVARYAEVSDDERAMLESTECPITLLRKQPESPIAEAVAPEMGELGVMLTYTPLHILLFESGVPFLALVMTSGNRRDEPIARTNDEAEERLAGIVDGFLFHNRLIHNRADDSIARILADGKVQMIRRARGYVPVSVPVEIEKTIFAAGAELKNTFCLTRRGEAFLSQHIGDLTDERTLTFYRETVEKYCRLLGVHPAAVCCDLHPDYMSTRFAESYAEANDLPLTRIQHHMAHVASILAEHQCRGPVLGVAFDGTGFGLDGAVWGGEFFLFNEAKGERIGHLEYFPLPGGDASVREVWRSALALLSSCGMDGASPGSLSEVPPETRAAVMSMINTRTNCPHTSSVGRLFDAASVIAGLGSTVSYEAEAAMRLEAISGEDFTPYRFEVSEQYPARILLGTLVRDMIGDAGNPRTLSSRFHATIASIILAIAVRAREDHGAETIALSGGVFQNRILTELSRAMLEEHNFRVLTNHLVPPNDGGISLGQAWLASRREGR